ncbi:MAG: serine/threonine-protein kinase [Acidimicrobiales bacterium]
MRGEGPERLMVTPDDLLHDRYEILEMLGRGAMGTVWKARDRVLDRYIALKVLEAPDGVDPDEAIDRFLIEARASARLSHPNIVGVHDVFRDGERVLISMELVEGPTLDAVLRDAAPLPAATVRAVMAQVAQALAAAHAAGVIHRDLKPENVFWTPDGRAVVGDFGLARIGAGRGTVEGTVMGTPGYMAPEQVRGLPVGPGVDVFGWGVVAYELVTGVAPFGDPSTTEAITLAYRIVHEPAPALHLPDDGALSALINRSLAKDPAERPEDGEALVDGLAEPSGVAVSATGPPAATRPHVSGQRRPPDRTSDDVPVATGMQGGEPAREAAMTPRLIALLGVLGLMTVTTIGWAGWQASQGRRSHPPPTASTTVTIPAYPLTIGAMPTEPHQTSQFRPTVELTLDPGWTTLLLEAPDYWTLGRANGPDAAAITFMVGARVVRRDAAPTSADDLLRTGELGPANGDFATWIRTHPKLTATSPATAFNVPGATGVKFDMHVTDPYAYDGCRNGGQPYRCVIMFLDTYPFASVEGLTYRFYVFDVGSSHVIVSVEARDSDFAQFSSLADRALSTLRFPNR